MTAETSAARVERLCDDLAAEHQALDSIAAAMDESSWSIATPAEGWEIRDQISHLVFFDSTANMALTDPERFQTHAVEFAKLAPEERDSVGDTILGRSLGPPELLDRWREGRKALVESARAASPDERVPWYAQPMSLASFVTARLMETWAHGQDILDALGKPPIASDRLRHVCEIGVRARPWSFLVHGREDPGDPVRIEVVSPSGDGWAWGASDASDRVTGTALDLALVFTQRRHLADTSLEIAGSTATEWFDVAQAFAGPPGTGRQPGLGKVVQ